MQNGWEITKVLQIQSSDQIKRKFYLSIFPDPPHLAFPILCSYPVYEIPSALITAIRFKEFCIKYKHHFLTALTIPRSEPSKEVRKTSTVNPSIAKISPYFFVCDL